MTTIIGVQNEGSCFLAADSRTTNDSGRPYEHEKVQKITERAGWLIAGAGDPNGCDIIQHIWTPPKQEKGTDDYLFVLTKVTTSIRKCLKENGYERDESDKEGGLIFLLAYKGVIYEIDDTFTVYMRSDGYYGIGSGSKWALGALQAGANWQLAMEIAELNDIYTSGPFVYYRQD